MHHTPTSPARKAARLQSICLLPRRCHTSRHSHHRHTRRRCTLACSSGRHSAPGSCHTWGSSDHCTCHSFPRNHRPRSSCSCNQARTPPRTGLSSRCRSGSSRHCTCHSYRRSHRHHIVCCCNRVCRQRGRCRGSRGSSFLQLRNPERSCTRSPRRRRSCPRMMLDRRPPRSSPPRTLRLRRRCHSCRRSHHRRMCWSHTAAASGRMRSRIDFRCRTEHLGHHTPRSFRHSHHCRTSFHHNSGRTLRRCHLSCRYHSPCNLPRAGCCRRNRSRSRHNHNHTCRPRHTALDRMSTRRGLYPDRSPERRRFGS